MMQNDPVIEEVRRAGKELEEEAQGDLHRFFDLLRKVQADYKPRVVKPVPPVSTSVSSLPPVH